MEFRSTKIVARHRRLTILNHGPRTHIDCYHDYYLDDNEDTESLDWTYDAPVTLLGRFLNM
jgi:hypothetical protein